MTGFDPRAVLDGRTPGRPSMGLIAGIAVSSVCALVSLALDAISGPVPAVIAIFLAVLPVPLLLAAVLYLDRLEPEPRRNLVLAFLWGAGTAALLAGIVNSLGLRLLTAPVFGPQKGWFVSATIGAPIVEETLKGAVLVGFLWLRQQELDGPTDGIIYAALVGLGFALSENVGYYIKALEHTGEAGLAATFLLRGIIAPFGHPAFTSMTGLGVAYAATHRGPGRGWAPVFGWIAAMLLHGFWNASTAYGLRGLAVAYLVVFCVIVALIVVVIVDRRSIVTQIARYLPAYAGTGLVTYHDVGMLSSLPRRRQARRWARLNGGLPAARAMGDYQLAATELALLHRRAERRIVTPLQFEQRRSALLTLMTLARTAFLRHRAQPAPPPWAPPGSSGFAQPPPPGDHPDDPPPPYGGFTTPGPRFPA